MRVCDGNIAGVTRCNFEICVDTNGSKAITWIIVTVDVVKVGADIDETVVTLRGGGKRGESGGGVGGGGW